MDGWKEIKCPFCGGPIRINEHSYSPYEDKYNLVCVGCGMEFSYKQTFHVYERNKSRLFERDFVRIADNPSLLEVWSNQKPIRNILERLDEQVKQYDRRSKEVEGKNITSLLSEKFWGKKCSYEHAIEIVKEEVG